MPNVNMIQAWMSANDLQQVIINKVTVTGADRKVVVGFGLFREDHYDVVRASVHGITLRNQAEPDTIAMELEWPDFWEEVGRNRLTQFSIYTESKK